MTARAAALCGFDTADGGMDAAAELNKFNDSFIIAEWARTPAAFCLNNNILPVTGAALKPGEKITRGEIAEILYRLLDLAELL
jgi:hypothetical protein